MDGWILGLRKKTAWGHQKKFLRSPCGGHRKSGHRKSAAYTQHRPCALQKTNLSRVIPLPFIGMKKGPIIICSSDKSLNTFFKHLGKVFVVKNEKLSKAFWSTSSFMAPYYNLLLSTSSWLISKGIKRKEAENYTRELFLALSEDSMNKQNLSLTKLVSTSQTPGGTNAFVLKKLKKTKFYSIQKKALNDVFKKF